MLSWKTFATNSLKYMNVWFCRDADYWKFHDHVLIRCNARLAWLMSCTFSLLNYIFLCFNQILDLIRMALDKIYWRFCCKYPLNIYPANKKSTKGRSFNVKTINAHKRGTRKEWKKRNSIRTSHTILLWLEKFLARQFRYIPYRCLL